MKKISLAFTLLLLAGLGYLAGSRMEKDDDRTEEEEEQGAYPSDWGWIQRTYPYYEADPDAYHQALRQADAHRAAAKSGASIGTWDFAGPTNVGGRVVDIEFDPLRPDTLYAAAATGGVFKSIDKGDTWEPIFDDQAVLTIGDIAIDPSNSNRIYVGTGEANGGHNNFAGAGVYKSSDGGATWRFKGLENTTSIARVLVHPTNPSRVYVAAAGSYFSPTPDRGLYRSDDGGNSWDRVLFVNDSTGVIDLVMRPDDPDVLFAATWERVRRYNSARLHGAGSGIYKSTDGGDTWEPLGPETGLPDPEDFTVAPGIVRFGRIGLSFSAGNPDVLHALYNDGFSHLGFYRSEDGGESWEQSDPNNQIAGGTGGFGWYFGQVRTHPVDPDIVYVLDVTFMRSTDSGQTWTRKGGSSVLHVDHHALAFHPKDPSFIIDGNDGGISISEDGGDTWRRVADLPTTQFYEITYDPSNPERLYGGTQDNGTIRTLTGATDDWERISGGDGFYVLVDPVNPNIIYAEMQNGSLVRSSDGGNTFTNIRPSGTGSEPNNWSTPVVMDPQDNKTLYYGTSRVYRTRNRGDSWTAISDPLSQDESGILGSITTIAIAPSSPAVIYAGTDDGNVWLSTDEGDTWNQVDQDLPKRWVTRIAVDPVDEEIAYVTFSGLKWLDPQPHVFRTSDQGQSWQNISGDPSGSGLPDAPVNAFAIDPLYPDVLFVGSDVGAFMSFDAGENWEALGDGLPAVVVSDFKVSADPHRLVAGTHGRSMYTLDLSVLDVILSNETEELPSDQLVLEPNFPNPFGTSTSIRFRLGEPGEVELAIYDLLGRRVRRLTSGPRGSGASTVVWDGTGDDGARVGSGVYVARIRYTSRAGTTTDHTTMTLVR